MAYIDFGYRVRFPSLTPPLFPEKPEKIKDLQAWAAKIGFQSF